MAKLGRPFVYQSDAEKPMTVSLRLPRDLYEQAQRYVRMRHPMTLTELLLDGLRLRLETPTDPRDILLSDDNTVMQELQEMIRTAVTAEVGKLAAFLAPRGDTAMDTPVPELSHDNNTVLQEQDASAPAQSAVPMPDISHCGNSVIQYVEASQASGVSGETSSPAPTDKAAIVARLRAMREQGMSLAKIADMLQAENVPTLSGAGEWRKSTISKLLRAAV
jgi:hypothetical protein